MPTTRKCPNPECCGARMRSEISHCTCDLDRNRVEFTTFVDVWECQNCHVVLPRQKRKARVERMTPAQVAALEEFKREFIRAHAGHRQDEYEIKTESQSLMSTGDVAYVIELGRKNDENTMASVFCRDRVQVSRSQGSYIDP